MKLRAHKTTGFDGVTGLPVKQQQIRSIDTIQYQQSQEILPFIIL